MSGAPSVSHSSLTAENQSKDLVPLLLEPPSELEDLAKGDHGSPALCSNSSNEFGLFCHKVLNVNKSVVGTDNDPTFKILESAVNNGSPAFWQNASNPTNKENLENLTKRCRNWISVLIRRKAYLRTLPALHVLSYLPLSDAMVNQIGIPSTASLLIEHTDSNEIVSAVHSLEKKYEGAFKSQKTNVSTTSKQSITTPKLFSDVRALKLRTHKRVRESTPPATSEPNWETTEDSTPDEEPGSSRKRAKTNKRVHWKPDSELVVVRLFEMDGIAKFKSAKNARQQEHDEGNAMHPDVEWITPRTIDFTGLFGNEQLRLLMSIRRGGLKEPDSEEARIQEIRESSTTKPHDEVDIRDSPKEPPLGETSPDKSWKPREGGKFTAAAPPREWLQRQNLSNPSMSPGLNTLMPQMSPMIPHMMPGFPWAMNYPMNMNMNMNMNMGMTPTQMNEMMNMGTNNNMFGKQ